MWVYAVADAALAELSLLAVDKIAERVKREVRALRARGLEIATFSIRVATSKNVLSGVDREAYATTKPIL